jgi:hypothetical protein
MVAVMVAAITAAQPVEMAVQVVVVATRQHQVAPQHQARVTMEVVAMPAAHQVAAVVQVWLVETPVQAQMMPVLVEMDQPHIHHGDWRHQQVKM